MGQPMLNLMFLIDHFHASYGGTEQHLLFLHRELPRDRYRVRFVVFSTLKELPVTSPPLDPIVLNSADPEMSVGFWKRLRRLTGLIRAEKVDIVHTFCPASELIALLATRCARLARVLGVRRNVGYWHTMGTLWRARLAGRLGARYAANCEAARRFTARREWISPRRIAVIPNPLSESRIREGLAAVPTRQALGLCDGEQTVGIVASVRPIKDHATFFRAARLVLDRHPRTRFLVIGHSRSWDRRDLDALIEQLGIGSQVCWMSEVANPVTVLPHFEVGVLSSLSEGFSNALLEYAAAGIPAVATDVGGTREVVVDKETGFLVPPQRPEFMARRICELLESPERRRQMGENARRRAETVFSQQAVLSAYDRLYARLARREEIA